MTRKPGERRLDQGQRQVEIRGEKNQGFRLAAQGVRPCQRRGTAGARIEAPQAFGEPGADPLQARRCEQQIGRNIVIATDETESIAGAPGLIGERLGKIGKHAEITRPLAAAHRA